MNAPSLFVLEPPYQQARRLLGVEPALGSIVLLDTVPERPNTNTVKEQLEVAPWCPLCLLAEKDSGVRPTRRLPRTCIVFGLSESDGAAAILRMVAGRPRPTPSDMVAWIQQRTRIPTLGRALSDLFTRAPMRRNEESFVPFSLSDQLRRLGEWGACKWQLASRLVEVAADRGLLNRTLSSGDAASTELRSAIPELLGVDEDGFRDRYGWEWVLECSLRRSGFFGRTSEAVVSLQSRRAVVPDRRQSVGVGEAHRESA
jgi:hypothetical protein